MRWSQLHIPTLREDPADADAASHRLLLRAGYIRQLMAGHYSLLPLGVRVRAKVIQIIREEMNRIGAQEFLLPCMQPGQIWEKSGRLAVMGDEMFKLQDRRGQLTVLGMTHEEIFASLAVEFASYRELPQFWYHFQTKFRDEPRSKSGLIRVREFTMKDSYSFDIDEAGLDVSFNAHRIAYERIFARLGIPAFGAEASNGTMGGSDSIEFVCPSNAGEDRVARCPDCGYAANLEKATSVLRPITDAEPASDAPVRLDTPGVRTIEDLAVSYGLAADRQIKTLVQVIDGKLTLVLLRGDHPLSDQKLTDATAAVDVRPAQPEEIRDALGALPGSLGAVGVTHFPIIADEALRGRRGMATGANIDDVHLTGVDVERDIPVGRWADLREVTEGEPCPRCGTALEFVHVLEVGHIFKLGRKFTTAFGVTVTGPDGGTITPIMGSYGIGVERAMAAIAEVHHDDAGLVWPVQVAPAAVTVLPLTRDAEVKAVAEELYNGLLETGVEALIDDRDTRPGVKFADAELTGIPFRVSVGSRDLGDGVVEVTSRATGEKERVAVGEAVGHLRSLVQNALGQASVSTS
jgi:prolyl-tRNA synthetase family II